MDGLQDLLHNDILLAGILSWLTAQVVKTILYAVINKEIDWTISWYFSGSRRLILRG